MGDLREATESAKDTIISQNEHIAQQDSSMRQLKKRLQSMEKDHSKQMLSLQRVHDTLHDQLERCLLILNHIIGKVAASVGCAT